MNELRRDLVARVLYRDATAPSELRRAAFDNAGLCEPMRTLIEKVAHHSSAVTDQDAALRAAGLSQDQIYEIVWCAAVGQANRQSESALGALSRAAAERGSRR